MNHFSTLQARKMHSLFVAESNFVKMRCFNKQVAALGSLCRRAATEALSRGREPTVTSRARMIKPRSGDILMCRRCAS
jgi:hypothetical protein